MNDRFKFRGITKGKVNKFIYGSLLWYAGEPQIWDKDGKNYIVKPETVGQCTGFKDKNGLENIYEYDIINIDGIKIGNIYEQEDLLKDTTNFVIKRMGTKEWRDSEQEAIKRGCYYAE